MSMNKNERPANTPGNNPETLEGKLEILTLPFDVVSGINIPLSVYLEE